MKAIEPNAVRVVHTPGELSDLDLAYLTLPDGTAARVLARHYVQHDLGSYRWYRGPRGHVVATAGRGGGGSGHTVYLSRLLAGADDRTRVVLREPEPYDLEDGGGLAFDYRPRNFRSVLCCGKSPT